MKQEEEENEEEVQDSRSYDMSEKPRTDSSSDSLQ